MILRLMKLVTKGILYTLYNRPLFFFKYFGVVAMYSCTLWEHALEVEAVAETYGCCMDVVWTQLLSVTTKILRKNLAGSRLKLSV